MKNIDSIEIINLLILKHLTLFHISNRNFFTVLSSTFYISYENIIYNFTIKIYL